MVSWNDFREGFFRGRLLWVRGSEELQKIEFARDGLRRCEIRDDQVLVLSVRQFLKLDFLGAHRSWLSRYRALILRDFNVDADEWRQFLGRLKRSASLRFVEGVRVILVSSMDLPLEQKLDLYRLNPSVIRNTKEALEPNERVHRLLQEASRRVQKPVLRVSERFAAFFEATDDEWSDSELLDWFTFAILRSQDGILRFVDLFPQNVLSEGSLRTS